MKASPLLALAFALILAPLARADFPAAVTADGPLAYYRFEEAPGATTLADSSGNGLDIDYSAPGGTTVLGETGAVGLAAMFNADDAILTPLTLDPSLGDFTIEAVFSVDRTTPAVGVILSNTDGAGVGRSNLVFDTPGSLHSYCGAATTVSGTIVEDATFYHVILTFDQSAVAGGVDPTFRFYVNGVAGGTSTFVPESADGAWVIGSNKDLATQMFAGLLDEVAVYGKRLDDPDGDGDVNDSRVRAHYKEYLADSDVLVTFESDTDYVDSGQSANLTWLVSPALTSLTLSDGVNPPANVLGNTIECDGSRTVSPSTTTTYTLEGISPVGTESLQLTVRVDEPAVIDSFTASASEVAVGGTADLSWEVTNGVVVEIDNGVGAVDPVAGTATATVNADTTYTLTASNSQGAVTATVTVEVFDGDPSLIAHWRVGEAPGETDGTTLVSEMSATGAFFDGTFVGASSFDTADPAPVPGGSTASISFDGANSYVDVLDYFGVTGGAARTVAFWFKGPATQTNDYGTLVSWGANVITNRWDVRVGNNSTGVLRTEVSGSGSNGTAIMADDAWHHCAAVFSAGTIGDIQFYIDGQPDTLSAAGATAVDTSGNMNVRLGASRAIAGRSLTGKMDDIRIYDRALSGDEIHELFEADETEFKITNIRRLENGDVEISWSAGPGEYSVEYSFDLIDWPELVDTEIPAGENSAVTVDDYIANPPDGPEPPRVHYRVRSLQ